MMKSEQETEALYESFFSRKSIEEQIKHQNKVITAILAVMVVGAILLLVFILL